MIRSARWPIVLVLLCTAIVYARSVGQDFVWDDGPALIHNPLFNPPTRATLAYYWTHASWNLYQPLTCTLWAACAKIGYVPTPDENGCHLSPVPFHVLNLLLHLSATFGVYRLLRTLRLDDAWAAVGAAVFALEPIQVEAVAFAGALNTPLYGCLAVFALDDYLHFIGLVDAQRKDFRRMIRYRGIVLYALAMLAQPVALIVPVIGIVLDRLVLRRPWLQIRRTALPWLALAAPMAVWTKLNQHGTAAAAQSPPWSRPWVALDNLAVQAGHVIWPTGLTIDYGRTPAALLTHPVWMLSGLATVAAGAVAWRLRRGRPLTSAGLAIAAIAMLPSSGIVPFDFEQFSSVADRHVYFAMVGFALVFVDTISRLPRRPALTAGVGVVAVCTALTMRQIGFWSDDVTLFRHGEQSNPNSWLCHQNLGAAWMMTDPKAAMQQFQGAIQLRPGHVDTYDDYAMSALNAGKPAAAEPALRAGLQLAPSNAGLHDRLGRTLELLGRPAAAADQYRQAVRLDPALITSRQGLDRLEAGSVKPSS